MMCFFNMRVTRWKMAAEQSKQIVIAKMETMECAKNNNECFSNDEIDESVLVHRYSRLLFLVNNTPFSFLLR